MKTVLIIALAFATLALRAPALLAQGVLTNPGFESGTLVPGGVGGWDGLSGSVSLSQSHAHGGTWSLQANYGFLIDPSTGYQWVAVQPGSNYTLSGWGLTPVLLPGGRQASLSLAFSDLNHVQLGQSYSSGIINSSSPLNTWVPLSVTATAPANAAFASVRMGVSFPQFQTPAGNAVYFDDMSLVPEPSSLALLAAGLGASLCFSRRNRQLLCKLWKRTEVCSRS